MPSKTSVCTLKPEADAKPGMPMCLGLWQVRQRAPATPDSPESCPTRLHLSSNLWALSFRERVPVVFWGPTLTGHRLLLGSCWKHCKEIALHGPWPACSTVPRCDYEDGTVRSAVELAPRRTHALFLSTLMSASLRGPHCSGHSLLLLLHLTEVSGTLA